MPRTARSAKSRLGSRVGARQALAPIIELGWEDVPSDVRRQLAWLLLDAAAVCVAGRVTPAARIAADYAGAAYAGDAATALLDGRRLSIPGAAWANGVLANALDYDDGHRITKGHPGAVVIPASLAAAEARDASLEELLTAVAVGYEVAIRAGIELHQREAQYHASGAWGALGAAAAVARLLGLGGRELEHALGLAEYHAPISPVMRSVGDPAMTKDATGWGASLGASSAMLAGCGFTALSGVFSAKSGFDLGERWRILEVYVKAHPCCRWAHPSIEAALEVRRGRPFVPSEVRAVTIRTFAVADGLSRRAPTTTEEAQYSLVWPAAAALVRGSFGVDDVVARLEDEAVAAVAGRTRVVVDPALESAFPARRLAQLTVELQDGSCVASRPVEARGEPGDPAWEAVIEDKVRCFLAPSVPTPAVSTTEPPDVTCGGRTVEELLALLTFALGPAPAPSAARRLATG